MLRLKRVLPTSSQSHVFMKVNSSIRYMYVIFISPTLFYVLKGWLNLQHRHGSFGGTSKKSYQRSSTRNEGIAAITNELERDRALVNMAQPKECHRIADSWWRYCAGMGLSNANGWQNLEGMYKNGMASVSISCSTCRIKVSVLYIFIYFYL